MQIGRDVPARVRAVHRDTSDRRFTPGVDNQGWWANTAAGGTDRNDNYFVGSLPSYDLPSFRDFFTFDLSGIHRRVVFARLELRAGMSKGDRSERLGLFHVRTRARPLNDNHGTRAQIYRDLGHGTSYGTFRVPTGAPRNATITLSLNQAAVLAINRAAGGRFSIGGTLLDVRGGADQYLFGATSHRGVQRLVLYYRER